MYEGKNSIKGYLDIMKKCIILMMIFCLIMPKTAFAIADSAECACVMNALTGEVIFDKNAYMRHPMASTTKIMTAIVALENSNPDDIVEISENAEMQEGSSAYVTAGSRMYMRDLLYGLMLNSGNDAAVAIAEHISGSTDAFVDLMNDKAWSIGANDTSFINPNGLHHQDHFTTARDLAWISRYAIKNSDFWNIVSTQAMLAHPVDSDEELWFVNHNKLLDMYEGCFGIKTGYTEAAGRCLVSAATRDNMTFIAVTLNDENDWNDHMEMLDYAFSKYYSREIISAGQTVKTASVDGTNYNFVAAESFTVPFSDGETLAIDVVNHLMDNLTGPINAGEKVGYMDISYGGEWIGTVDIISESDVVGVNDIRLRNSFYDTFLNVLKLWCI
jgi:D-alanyl-D-alanine carboxypeptidase (penicillin-binding protein 5/6)